ncbi:sensor histidine kinase [Indiicoccus explosivorum]|uniref:sensor histidine kinase n=1 Tax=Indiicoccus explosivorum TaxID=1917864 RepID=UPI000B44561D|nr:HAMP domain-containing sensor histidine kinase [Indiicoccus explosivorum]
MNLRTRIMLLSVLISGLIFTAAGSGVYIIYKESLLNRAENALETKAGLISDNETPAFTKGGLEEWLEQFEEDDWRLWVFDEEDRLLAEAGEEDEFSYAQLRSLAADGELLTGAFSLDGTPDASAETLVLAYSLEETEEELQLLLGILGGALLAVMILAAAGGRFLAFTILKPISRLIQTMEHNEKRDTFERIAVSGSPGDELQRMAVTFNSMMSKMEANFERQKSFVSDASHELKTPITVIESYAALLGRWGGEDKEVREEAVGTIRSETKRMKAMVHALLELASLQDSGQELVKEPVDLTEAVRNAAKEMEAVYHRPVGLDLPDAPVVAEGNPENIRQLLVILLDNALKYSGTTVQAAVKEEKNYVILTIADEGIGIPEEEQDLVFERFYRVDKSRQRQTGGTGLGLAIAKSIVGQHGGQITLKSKENEGTTVTVTLPRKF